jgi:hypothetical protein
MSRLCVKFVTARRGGCWDESEEATPFGAIGEDGIVVGECGPFETDVGVMQTHSKRAAALKITRVIFLRPRTSVVSEVNSYWTMRGRPREEPFISLTLLMQILVSG